MVVICIPIYKTELDWYEKISLNQALRVFVGKYDVFLCVPDSIKDYYHKTYGGTVGICTFHDVYFTSVKAYSELCLSEFFYRRFDEYEYMLIYQLDAFVFSDMVKEFCELGYDYIGADSCDGSDWNRINESIGCGGLSLRRIPAVLGILSEHSEILTKHPLRGTFWAKEDVFWGYCGHNHIMDFRIPDFKVANSFAVTFGAPLLLEGEHIEKVPFGTHAWHRYDYDFWKPIIGGYGYNMPEAGCVEYRSTTSVYQNVDKYRKLLLKIKANKLVLSKVTAVSLWGAGYNGVRCIRLLNLLGITINHIFDWNENALACVEDIKTPKLEIPTCSNIQNLSDKDILIICVEPDAEIVGKTKTLNTISYDKFLEMVESETENC